MACRSAAGLDEAVVEVEEVDPLKAARDWKPPDPANCDTDTIQKSHHGQRRVEECERRTRLNAGN